MLAIGRRSTLQIDQSQPILDGLDMLQRYRL